MRSRCYPARILPLLPLIFAFSFSASAPSVFASDGLSPPARVRDASAQLSAPDLHLRPNSEASRVRHGLREEGDAFGRVGSWPFGQAKAIAVDPGRRLAFLGSGGAVLVLDVSDANDPVLLSDDIETLGLVLGIAYDAATQRLFLACNEGGLEIWDLQNPAVPVQITVFEVLYYDYETPVTNVYVQGNYAAVNTEWGYVRTIDVSDPYHPFQVSFSGLGGHTNDIYLHKSGALHTAGDDAYIVFHIRPDGTLEQGVTYSNWYTITGLAAGNATTGIAHNNGYLYFLNLQNPSNPITAALYVGHNLNDIEVNGNYVYLAKAAEQELWIIDMTDLYNPQVVGLLNIGGGPRKVVVSEHRAYVANGFDGLQIVDVGDPAHPIALGSYDTFGATVGMHRRGDYAYLTELDDGVLVMDLTDLSDPTLVGQWDPATDVDDLDISGSLLFAAAYEGGLRIADLTDPLHPSEIGAAPIAHAWRVAVSGTTAYVTDLVINEQDWLRVIDCSDPQHPVETGALLMPGWVREIDVSGNYLYAAMGDLGLRVVDVSDPENPWEVGTYPAPNVLDVEVRGDRAFLASADAQGGLFILDVSDPPHPSLISRYAYGGGFYAFDVAVSGEFAYVSVPTRGFIVAVYVGDPEHPAELGTFVASGDMSDLAAADSLVYLSDGSAGLVILENLLFSDPAGGVAWFPQESGTSQHLRRVRFLDAAVGWAAGDNGTLIKTTDGGQQWSPLASGTSEDLHGLSFADAAVGWLGGRAGVLRKTTDGGGTWIPQNSGTSELILDIQFLDASLGWAVGTGGVIRKTTDGGSHWLAQYPGTTESLGSVFFLNDQLGWTTGGMDGAILRTTDGGSHWQTVPLPGSLWGTNSVRFIDEQTGWLSASDAAILKSVDGGLHWTVQYDDSNTPYSYLNEIAAIDAGQVWVVGGREVYGQSLRTLDGGVEWTTVHGGNDQYLQSCSFVDAGHGWAVGQFGAIFTTVANPAGLADGFPPNRPSAGTVLLHQNRPNPFGEATGRSATTILYRLTHATRVELVIHDAAGRRVRTIEVGPQRAGERAALWDGRDDRGVPVPSGVYLYSLRAGGGTARGKAAVVR